MDREIEEILRRIDQHPSRRRRTLRWKIGAGLRNAQETVISSLSNISLGHIMIASFLIICVAYFFLRINPAIMRWVIVAGLVIFITSFIVSLRRGGRSAPHYERRWRGQRIDYDEPRLTDRLRWWFDRNRRGRR
jgi:hypothetical protein